MRSCAEVSGLEKGSGGVGLDGWSGASGNGAWGASFARTKSAVVYRFRWLSLWCQSSQRSCLRVTGMRFECLSFRDLVGLN